MCVVYFVAPRFALLCAASRLLPCPSLTPHRPSPGKLAHTEPGRPSAGPGGNARLVLHPFPPYPLPETYRRMAWHDCQLFPHPFCSCRGGSDRVGLPHPPGTDQAPPLPRCDLCHHGMGSGTDKEVWTKLEDNQDRVGGAGGERAGCAGAPVSFPRYVGLLPLSCSQRSQRPFPLNLESINPSAVRAMKIENRHKHTHTPSPPTPLLALLLAPLPPRFARESTLRHKHRSEHENKRAERARCVGLTSKGQPKRMGRGFGCQAQARKLLPQFHDSNSGVVIRSLGRRRCRPPPWGRCFGQFRGPYGELFCFLKTWELSPPGGRKFLWCGASFFNRTFGTCSALGVGGAAVSCRPSPPHLPQTRSG